MLPEIRINKFTEYSMLKIGNQINFSRVGIYHSFHELGFER